MLCAPLIQLHLSLLTYSSLLLTHFHFFLSLLPPYVQQLQLQCSRWLRFGVSSSHSDDLKSVEQLVIAGKRLNMSSEDRISELPADTRKHILSFLTTRDAIRTSALSRTWRYDWVSLPCLNFGREFFLKRWKFDEDILYRHACQDAPSSQEALKFLEFLDTAVISKRPTIQKLHLYLPPITGLSSKIASCLDGFIVNELDVEVIGDRDVSDSVCFYYVPKCVLSSNPMTKLSIHGCKLSGISINEINLPSLRELSVSQVVMDQQMVEILMASCTGVEKLCITYCKGFRSLVISGLPNLTYLEQKGVKHLRVFEINVPNLCFLGYAPYDSYCRIQLSASCQTLTHLELKYCRFHLGYGGLDIRTCHKLSVLRLLRCELNDDFLDQHLSQLFCLQFLEIAFCTGSSHLKITSGHLRSLTIQSDGQFKHARINCPNLHDFSFCTRGRIISLSSDTKIAPACVTIQLSLNGTGDSTWDVKLVELLAQLRLSKCISIETSIIENVITPKRLRQRYRSPLCQFEQVKLFPHALVSCLDVTRSIEALLWLCPQLKTLHILDNRLGPNPPSPILLGPRSTTSLKMLLKLNYKEPGELNQTSCGCHPDLPVNCWRHSLKGFEIIEQQGFEDDDGRLRRFLESAVTGV